MTRHDALITTGACLLALLPALAPAEAAAGAICPETDSVDLIAGRDIQAGDVKVCNDAENLYVTYEPTGPWCVADTNLHVATGLDGIPRTRSGSPKPEEFADGGPPEWDECTVTFKIPLDEIGAEPVAAGDTLVIAAQADLLNLTSGRQEGAWAAGTRFTERGNWATYFTYTVEESLPCGGEDSKCIFVTSTTHNGNLGGWGGADAICQARAEAEGSLAAPGTYKAWLTDSQQSNSPAGGRFTQSSVPYRLVDGTQIASDWPDLIDGTLNAGITLTEGGDQVAHTLFAWTNTKPNGTRSSNFLSVDHCSNWTNGTNPTFGVFGGPIVGRVGATGGSWTDSSGIQCGDLARLYCFQQ